LACEGAEGSWGFHQVKYSKIFSRIKIND
jgi:hypothetical protein